MDVFSLHFLTLYEQDKRNVTFKANVTSLKIQKLRYIYNLNKYIYIIYSSIF